MLGLTYAGAFALYTALLFVVVRWAWRKGRSNAGGTARGIGFAVLAFLCVFLPVFWNLIPTLLVHRYYCARDAGFAVRVPAEQWRVQHRQEIETVNRLPRDRREATSSSQTLPDGFARFTYFGGLLASDFKAEPVEGWGISVRRLTWRKVDAVTGMPLATATDYQTGDNDIRFWLNAPGCVQNPPTKLGEQPQFLTPLDRLASYDRQLTGAKHDPSR